MTHGTGKVWAEGLKTTGLNHFELNLRELQVQG